MGRRRTNVVRHEDGHVDGRPRAAPPGQPDPMVRALMERGHAFAQEQKVEAASKPKPGGGAPKPPAPPPRPEPPRPAAATGGESGASTPET